MRWYTVGGPRRIAYGENVVLARWLRVLASLAVQYNCPFIFPIQLLSSVSIYHYSLCHYIRGLASQYHIHSAINHSPCGGLSLLGIK